ncbi:MAG: hypothetical protein JNM99_22495 [Verrucomicrobiaceae bacterium]|nr:hypothetical protein [Verrucomicrobiaceae bacterium]
MSRIEPERRRGFDADATTAEEQARRASLYFGALLHGKLRAFNPQYQGADGASIGQWQRLPSSIAGNRNFLKALRNHSKFFCAEENRELDLMVIDYAALKRAPSERRNVCEVTEEFYFNNGRHDTREDVVFLINGIPVRVIECKNASKDEDMAPEGGTRSCKRD